MAKRYFGLDRGDDEASVNVTVGSSTGNTDVELVLDDASGVTKMDVRLLAERLIRFVEDDRAGFPGI